MKSDQADPKASEVDSTPDVVGTLIDLVRTGIPAEQCLAISALASWATSDGRDVLIEATRFEDPDVRVDALEALAALGADDLGETFLWSLTNDPVGDAKVAALRGLGPQDAQAAEALLRSLLKGRSDEEVAWEDDTSDWDDWLDVQKEAIHAVGRLKLETAVGDLSAAANDEFGQDLWPDVLEAQALLGRSGLLAIIEIGQNPSARLRTRTAKSLVQANDPIAGEALLALARDTDPDVRLAASEALFARGEALPSDLLMQDPDARIRHFVVTKADDLTTKFIADAALNDKAEDVRLGALSRLRSTELTEGFETSFLESLGTKLRGASTALLSHIASLAGCMKAPEAAALLIDIDDHNAAPGVRRAVISALAKHPCEASLERLSSHIPNDSQMVRLAALAALSEISKTEGDVADNASALLLMALLGGFAPDAAEGNADEDRTAVTDDEQSSAKARNDNPRGTRRIKLDRDGNILSPDEPAGEDETVDLAKYRRKEGDPLSVDLATIAESDTADAISPETADIVAFPTSTLSAITQTEEDHVEFVEEKIDLSPRDLEFLELAQKTVSKKRVRPDIVADVALDIQRIAARLSGEQPRGAFVDGLLACLESRDTELRRGASSALLTLAENGHYPTIPQWETIHALPPEADPVTRAQVTRLLGVSTDEKAVNRLYREVNNKEPGVQIAAIETLSDGGHIIEGLQHFLSAVNRSVRCAAACAAIKPPQSVDPTAVVEAAMQESGALVQPISHQLVCNRETPTGKAVLKALVDECATRGARRMIALAMLKELKMS